MGFPPDFLKVRPAADTCSQFANHLLFKEQVDDVISRKVLQKRPQFWFLKAVMGAGIRGEPGVS